MVRSGKASPLVVLGTAGTIGLIILLVFMQSTDSPNVRVQKFLTGLAQGDVDQIMKVSTFGGEPDETVRKKWQECLHRTEYYRFFWRIKETITPTPDEAIVGVEMYRGIDRGQPYQEKYQIPVVKENGEWFVDAKSLDRRVFPALPR